MPKLNEKGLIQFVVILILSAGIIAGVYLVTAGPLKLFPRAISAPVSGPIPLPTPEAPPVSGPVILRPDLVVETVDFLGSPIVGTNADFDIRVKNTGQAIASHPNSILVNVVIRKPNDVLLGNCVWVFNNLAASETITAERGNECPKYNIDGPHKVIIEVDPHIEGISGLDRVAESDETNNTKEILVDVTKTSVSAPVGGPPTRVITQFRYAENPAELQNAAWQSYSQGLIVAHTFSDSSAGPKFIFVQFRDGESQIVKIDGQDYITSSIELIRAFSTPPAFSSADSFRDFIFDAYGFTDTAAEFIKANSTITVGDLSNSACGGGGWTPSTKTVALSCVQHEAAVHELSHVWWHTYRLQNPQIVKELAKDLVRLADGDGSDSAVAFAKIYVYGEGSFKGMYCTDNGCVADVHNLSDSDFDLTESAASAKIIDWEIYAGLSSWTMGRFRDGSHALPPYMWQYFEPEFSGTILLTPYYGGSPLPTTTPSPVPTSSPSFTPAASAPVNTGRGSGRGGGGGSAPSPTPAAKVIKYVRYAESPAALTNTATKGYVPNSDYAYEFEDTTAGSKFIFIQFLDEGGNIIKLNGRDYIESSPIELKAPEPIRVPPPAPVTKNPNTPTPLAADDPNCPIENPKPYGIGTLYKMCSIDQLARFDLKWLNDFPNEILIDIGRRKGNLGAFLADFSNERLLGLKSNTVDYTGSGFSLGILGELSCDRIKGIGKYSGSGFPGYIQEQLNCH